MPSRGIKLSIFADQFNSLAGGGRFVRGLITSLVSTPDILERIESVCIILTQGEAPIDIQNLPPKVSVLRRRFPSRLRDTFLANAFGFVMPRVDVAYGPFYYAFPNSGKARVVTVHDLSCFNERYHPPREAIHASSSLSKMVHSCQAIVCDSDATLRDFRQQWPHLASKAVRIYPGVYGFDSPSRASGNERNNSILVVGTLEPRKNYAVILEAFTRLCSELGTNAPKLDIYGSPGWMTQGVEERIHQLQIEGRCNWVRDATDEQLVAAYSNAGVFSYLSQSEGFGYPPFEAAYARCPMVLSNASSVGEIWASHAYCVPPDNVDEIVKGWKWALALNGDARDAVLSAQERCAREYTWFRAISEYVCLFESLTLK